MAFRFNKIQKRIIKRSFHRKVSDGFTLIEVSVVLLVLTVLTYLMSSLLSNMSIFKSTEGEAELLKKSMLFCSQTASISNEVIYLELDLDDESYRAYRMERSDEGAKEEEIIHKRSLSNFHSIISVSVSGGGRINEKKLTIPFAPDGIAQELAIYLGPDPEVNNTILLRKYGSHVDIVQGEATMILDNPEWEEKLEDL